MDVLEKFQSTIAAGASPDWPQLCRELDAEHATAQSTEVREQLLALFCVMMDMVERIEISATAMATFRTGRCHHYHRLLLREAGPAGRPSRKALLDITAREVLCGRMTPDDALRLMADAGVARPALPKAITPARMPLPQAQVGIGRWQQFCNSLAVLLSRPPIFPRKATHKRMV